MQFSPIFSGDILWMWIKERNHLLDRLLYRDWIEQHIDEQDFIIADPAHRCCDMVDWIDSRTKGQWAYRHVPGGVAVYLEDPREAAFFKLRWG